jgi:MFS family permease
LADFFPKQRRALAMAIYSAGVYLGMGISLPLGGWISDRWDQAYVGGGAPFGLVGWQVVFLSVGVPGLAIALWVLSLREPARGAQEGQRAPAVSEHAWRQFGADLLAIVPPFTLMSASRTPGGLQRNLALGAGFAVLAALFIWVTGDKFQWIAYFIGIYAIASWVQSLQQSDRVTFHLIWGTPTVVLAIIGFGGLAVVTYSFGFWVAPFAIRTFGVSAHVVGTTIGIPGTVAAAVGVVIGGRLSDGWKARSPKGRIFVAMLAAILPIPFMAAMFLTHEFAIYSILSPCVYFFANMWAGSAVAAYQDCVLPRMYGTVGATYLLGSTMIGLALGPYGSGKVAAVTGSLRMGVLSLLVVPVVTVTALWLVSRRIAEVEATRFDRARSYGERI